MYTHAAHTHTDQPVRVGQYLAWQCLQCNRIETTTTLVTALAATS